MNNQKEQIRAIVDEVCKVIIGKRQCVEQILCAILSNGHVMIEDIPGVGKTTMALAFARSMGLGYHRMQFTPDIMPSDITGFTFYKSDTGTFEYQQGAVMCNLFLADEINRTSPKTQSALLEVMEENSVTVDTVRYQVPQPFIVIATENPAGYTGTQLLPESQLDRFAVSVVIGYPEPEDEIHILKSRAFEQPLAYVNPVICKETLMEMQKEVSRVLVKDEVYRYIVNLANETRNHPGITQGLSPRGTLTLAALSRAAAYMNGRNYVIPDDVLYVFGNVVRHRLVMSSEAKMNHQTMEMIIADVVRRVNKPVPERMKFHGK